MKFNIQINNETIRQAAKLVMDHYQDKEFYLMVCSEREFNYTNDMSHQVSARIHYANLKMNVVAYTTWNPYSKVIGYASGDTIYCNTRKLNLPLKDRVENLFHESLHVLGYSHRGNKVNTYNLSTVPYKASSIFTKYLISIGEL